VRCPLGRVQVLIVDTLGTAENGHSVVPLAERVMGGHVGGRQRRLRVTEVRAVAILFGSARQHLERVLVGTPVDRHEELVRGRRHDHDVRVLERLVGARDGIAGVPTPREAPSVLGVGVAVLLFGIRRHWTVVALVRNPVVVEVPEVRADPGAVVAQHRVPAQRVGVVPGACETERAVTAVTRAPAAMGARNSRDDDLVIEAARAIGSERGRVEESCSSRVSGSSAGRVGRPTQHAPTARVAHGRWVCEAAGRLRQSNVIAIVDEVERKEPVHAVASGRIAVTVAGSREGEGRLE
jgi:hypothetical protein